MHINRVTLMGTLTHDPECRYEPDGSIMIFLDLVTRIAGSTNHHRARLIGEHAILARECFCEGDEVLIEGFLTEMPWMDEMHDDHLVAVIVVDARGIARNFKTLETNNDWQASDRFGCSLETRVLKSAAGYYLGTLDPELGPVSRESREYWETEKEAQEALLTGAWTQRNNP